MRATAIDTHQRAMRWVGVAILLALLAGQLLIGAAPATAQARVTVSPASGLARDAATRVTVSGQGFQVVQGGFGGVYVFFGWVDDASGGSWRPSRGGVTGQDYLYVPDSEERDNQGFQRYIAFPGSSTSSSANGGELAADGSWSLTMNVPGERFTAIDRTGSERVVDCAEVTCGVITVGAHGVANANNETFTPVRFAAAAAGGGTGDTTSGTGGGADGATSGAGGAAGQGTGGTTASSGQSDAADETGGDAAGGDDAAAGDEGADEGWVPDVPATVGVDQSTAMVGRVLTFVGRGFKPGEQVLVTLDDGVAAAGPLTAGRDGEVAGVLQLPAGIAVGTHVLRMTGAASEQAPQVELTVRADPIAVAAAEAAAAERAAAAAQQPATWVYVVVGVAALVFLWLVLSSLVAGWRRRRDRRRVASSAAAGSSGSGSVRVAERAPQEAIS